MRKHFIGLVIVVHIAMMITACERSTRVAIAEPAVPPTFRLSGNGNLYHFIVVGPYSSEKDLARPDAKVGVIWQLSPGEYAGTRVDDLPQITYGRVPRGFTQDTPAAGSPPVLEPGKFYGIGTPSISANFEVFCFKVEQSAVVEVDCE